MPPIDPSLLLMSLFGQKPGMGQQQQTFDFTGLLKAMRNDPQGDANKGYVSGVNNEANPFSNGFFQPHGGQQGAAPQVTAPPQQNPFAFSQQPQLTMFDNPQVPPATKKKKPVGGFSAGAGIGNQGISTSPFQY